MPAALLAENHSENSTNGSLQDDIVNNLISLKEFIDMFKGEPVKRAKKDSPQNRGAASDNNVIIRPFGVL